MSYYGVGIDNYLGEAGRALKPALLHIAEEDGFVSKESQAKIKAGLTAPNFQLCSYPGRDHAFARDGGKHFHQGDALKASKRAVGPVWPAAGAFHVKRSGKTCEHPTGQTR